MFTLYGTPETRSWRRLLDQGPGPWPLATLTLLTLSEIRQLFGSSGAGIRTSSGLLPSSVLFQRTLYVLTLGEGEATQATSPESSSTRKFVGARGRVVKLPVRGGDEVSVSLPKGVARCSTWSEGHSFNFLWIVFDHPPAPRTSPQCQQCLAI